MRALFSHAGNAQAEVELDLNPAYLFYQILCSIREDSVGLLCSALMGNFSFHVTISIREKLRLWGFTLKSLLPVRWI